jgi:DNA-binding NarL/FixJ family response regulator
MITVALIEDDRALRDSLAALLNGSPGFHFAGAWPNTETALKHLPRDKPDVALMDIHLPGASGIKCVRELKARAPKTRVLMLTIDEASPQVFTALEAGAFGYLIKGTPAAKILEAIEEVHRGGAPMSPPVARHVIDYFHRHGQNTREVNTLTPREKEVLELLSSGYRNKEIAAKLGCAQRTIEAHCHNLYEKLHVQSRTEAAAKFLRK